MGDIGFGEILLIAVVILVLFGSKKIPEFMRGLGKGVREFNDAKDSVRRELESGMKEKDSDVNNNNNSVQSNSNVSASSHVES